MCCLSDPWLLNLSTCDSGRIDGGHALWNVFEMASLAGGAANVISSLWRVLNFAALLLNRHLYLQLAKGSPLPAALQSAMLHVTGMGKAPTLKNEAEILLAAYGSSCQLGQMLGEDSNLSQSQDPLKILCDDAVLSEEDRCKLKSLCHPGFWAYPRLCCKLGETKDLKETLYPSGSTYVGADLRKLITETDLRVKQLMLSGILMHFIDNGQISDMVNMLNENCDCLDIQSPCCSGLTPLQYAVQKMSSVFDDALPLPFGVDLLEALIELGSSPDEMTAELREGTLSNNKMVRLLNSSPTLMNILFSGNSSDSEDPCDKSGESGDCDDCEDLEATPGTESKGQTSLKCRWVENSIMELSSSFSINAFETWLLSPHPDSGG